MAYSNWGAFTYLNGERRRDKEDVGVYDTDEADVPSGARIYVNLVKNYDAMMAGQDHWWRHSHHGVMGDGHVRCCCYKDGFPDVYVWPDGAEEPYKVPEEDIIAHNGWDGETFVTEYERQDGTAEKYIDHWNEDVDLAFTVPGLDGYLFGYRNGRVCHAYMTEPDGSEWTCDYGMEYGAGFMD